MIKEVHMKIILIASLIFSTACASMGQIEDLKIGMTKDEVKDTLRGPDRLVAQTTSTQTYAYRLSAYSKPVQILMALPTVGLIFLKKDEVAITYSSEGKMMSYQEYVIHPN